MRDIKVSRSILLWGLLVFGNVLCADAQGTVSFGTIVNAYLSGSCETPPNSSRVLGVARIYFPPDAELSSNVLVSCRVELPLAFSPTSSAIYGPAPIGQKGSFVADLGQSSFFTNIAVAYPNWITNVTLIYSNDFNLTPAQIGQLTNGLWYVETTSAKYPRGELRGQFNNRPVLLWPRLDAPGMFSFTVNGPPQSTYEIQASSDLLDWSVLDYAQSFPDVAFSGILGLRVGDQSGTNYSYRFYRVGVVPP